MSRGRVPFPARLHDPHVGSRTDQYDLSERVGSDASPYPSSVTGYPAITQPPVSQSYTASLGVTSMYKLSWRPYVSRISTSPVLSNLRRVHDARGDHEYNMVARTGSKGFIVTQHTHCITQWVSPTRLYARSERTKRKPPSTSYLVSWEAKSSHTPKGVRLARKHLTCDLP